MLTRQEYYLAAGRHILGLDVIPVVEMQVTAGVTASLHSCIAMARPLGFAILTSDKGYWLVTSEHLSAMAHAIADCTAAYKAS